MEKKVLKEIITTETEKFSEEGKVIEKITQIHEKFYAEPESPLQPVAQPQAQISNPLPGYSGTSLNNSATNGNASHKFLWENK